jgi:hypothetical protein
MLYGGCIPGRRARKKLPASQSRPRGTDEYLTLHCDAVYCFECRQEIIIISTVRSSGIGFIDSPQRFNVALTRAKRHVIVVGNGNNLRSNPLWSALLDHAAHFPNLEPVLELIDADPSAEYAPLFAIITCPTFIFSSLPLLVSLNSPPEPIVQPTRVRCRPLFSKHSRTDWSRKSHSRRQYIHLGPQKSNHNMKLLYTYIQYSIPLDLQLTIRLPALASRPRMEMPQLRQTTEQQHAAGKWKYNHGGRGYSREASASFLYIYLPFS